MRHLHAVFWSTDPSNNVSCNEKMYESRSQNLARDVRSDVIYMWNRLGLVAVCSGYFQHGIDAVEWAGLGRLNRLLWPAIR
jgi:hypothetical protein